ncbi:unnamed protein product [Nyctereutes procyonoides]|uniref:(raccoon dog) hypothetical protein n=1 Tax=Nyctereutes procyonoides TaxID=34880 RepID=A0A811YUX6_NYCPR|nr:unnamed protein product [Nyctereutes procyonoides]
MFRAGSHSFGEGNVVILCSVEPRGETNSTPEQEGKRRLCEEGDRDWSEVAASQETPEATRSWKGPRRTPIEPSEGTCSHQHLEFELLASKTVKE